VDYWDDASSVCGEAVASSAAGVEVDEELGEELLVGGGKDLGVCYGVFVLFGRLAELWILLMLLLRVARVRFYAAFYFYFVLELNLIFENER